MHPHRQSKSRIFYEIEQTVVVVNYLVVLACVLRASTKKKKVVNFWAKK